MDSTSSVDVTGGETRSLEEHDTPREPTYF
jgi:hypothetical protein